MSNEFIVLKCGHDKRLLPIEHFIGFDDAHDSAGKAVGCSVAAVISTSDQRHTEALAWLTEWRKAPTFAENGTPTMKGNPTEYSGFVVLKKGADNRLTCEAFNQEGKAKEADGFIFYTNCLIIWK